MQGDCVGQENCAARSVSAIVTEAARQSLLPTSADLLQPATNSLVHAATCVLQEAAATAEALEAERAAKFAADAEARELQRVLEEVRPCYLCALL